jgi:hypothetical protein
MQNISESELRHRNRGRDDKAWKEKGRSIGSGGLPLPPLIRVVGLPTFAFLTVNEAWKYSAATVPQSLGCKVGMNYRNSNADTCRNRM